PTMELLPLLPLLLPGPLGTAIEVIPLDMAPHSFDDQYRGCRQEMAEELPKLKHSEFSYSKYSEAWNKATDKWSRHQFLGSLSRKEQAIALWAYTLETDLYKDFNKAVPMAGRSGQEHLHNFPFKMLHFLLTEALEDLRKAKTHRRCFHVFRGVRNIRFTVKPEDIVRFGQFASTSPLRNVSQHYGTHTFFEVYTCYGAAIQNFSSMPWEEEVLIPPYETFKVTRVIHKGDETHIHLNSSGEHSNYNCEWHRGDIPG
ncbi:NARE ribosyltransferase, partial [Serilophus lunatus]|nr:NARE ribosyltransferase [Serilophus lunatus]